MVKRIKSKRGSIFIVLSFFFIIMFIILFNFYMLFLQFNSQIINIRTDIFYIAQNALYNINKYELGFENYIFDIEKIRKDIENIINLNYKKEEKSVKVTNINYYMKGQRDKLTEEIFENPTVHLELEVLFEPIVLKGVIGKKKIKLHEDIKMSLMESK